MAASLQSLTLSFSSLSFSSNITPKPQTLTFPRATKPISYSSSSKASRLVISASAAGIAMAPEVEGQVEDLEKYVKSRLPGGFAAQTLIGTGRRKCAIARVVIQEGTGKFIINYRDAKLCNVQRNLHSGSSGTTSLCFQRERLLPIPTPPYPALSGSLYGIGEYLQGNPLWIQYIKTPLATLGYETSYDVFVKAHGGGLAGQAQAISLGIARALLKVSASHRSPLKKEGLLTRDSRIVERKKAGLHKARKAPQFSKR